MIRALGTLGDRMLSALLPTATAAACQPNDPYYECRFKNSCHSNRTTRYYCTNNCAGVEFCNPVGCCSTN